MDALEIFNPSCDMKAILEAERSLWSGSGPLDKGPTQPPTSAPGLSCSYPAHHPWILFVCFLPASLKRNRRAC
jgi:hypothetical protein